MTNAMIESQTSTTTVTEWNAEQVRLVKSLLTDNLTDPEFQLFAQICHRTGLDPFTKQLYAIKRNGRMTIQTGIDGYRVIAERTGEYIGGDAPTYGPPCECERAKTKPHPSWASVTVRRLKDGTAYDTSDRADFDEYYVAGYNGKPGMWDKMPKRMIAKCAEALALRRAFPGLFEGVYTQEEMDQADVVQRPPEATTTARATANVVDHQPAAGADSGLEPGEREFREGDWCPECQRLKDETGQDVIIGKFRPAKGGPNKGELQCSGRREGEWSNHPLPISAADEARVRQLEASGDIDPNDIPF